MDDIFSRAFLMGLSIILGLTMIISITAYTIDDYNSKVELCHSNGLDYSLNTCIEVKGDFIIKECNILRGTNNEFLLSCKEYNKNG